MSQPEILRDKAGHTIGQLETKPDGSQLLRDKNGHTLGQYDPKSKITRDKNGHTVGKGNLLTSLLKG